MIGMLFNKPFLFFLNDINPPDVYQFLLLHFLSLCLLGLSILAQLDFPQPLNLPLMFLLLDPPLFPCHLFEPLLLCQFVHHFLPKVILQECLLLPLPLPVLQVFSIRILEHVREELPLLLLFLFLLGLLPFLGKLVVLDPEILELLDLPLSNLLGLPKTQVDYLLLGLFLFGLLLLKTVSSVQRGLVLGDCLKLGLVTALLQLSGLFLCLVLFLHYLVQALLLLLVLLYRFSLL